MSLLAKFLKDIRLDLTMIESEENPKINKILQMGSKGLFEL